jgi:hypothetical protein
MLPQVDDLSDDVGVRSVRAGLGPLGSGPQAFDALGEIAAVEGVIRLPANPEVPAGHRDIAGDVLNVLDDR